MRPLNVPIPIGVDVDHGGRPVAVRRRGWSRPRGVARIQDRWRIDDEWWHARPISRLYYAVLLEDETLLTIYQDRIAEAWFEQRDHRSAGSR